MLRRFKIQIIAWLLHHANRGYRNEFFYKIKNELLLKYGVPDGRDMQFFEGKKCRCCGGSGIYYGYKHSDSCWHCTGGWYKQPVRILLNRFKVGKYLFHQPGEKFYYWKNVTFPGDIVGFIDHDKSKHNTFARTVLFLMYEKGYLKRWYKDSGLGWCTYAWRPSNWPNNFCHLIKNGSNSIPVRDLKQYLTWAWNIKPISFVQFQKRVKEKPYQYYILTDDLPF